MSFLDSIADLIEGQTGTKVSIPMLSADEESIAIRPTPSSNLSNYVDGGKTYEYSFQLLVKNKSVVIAEEQSKVITEMLDGMTKLEGFNLIKIEVYTRPSWLEKNDQGCHVYTALFTAEMEGVKVNA